MLLSGGYKEEGSQFKHTEIVRVSLTVRACCASVLLLTVLTLTGIEWELIVMVVSSCSDIHVKPQDLTEPCLIMQD